MVEIVQAEEKDLLLIQQLANETWPDTFGSILSKAQILYMIEQMYSLESLTEQVRHKGHVFLLAKQAEQYLGYASYELNHKQHPRTKIHKLYLLPKAQGKGIGKQLIEEISTIAQLRQNLALTLNVNKYNPAIQFYLKLGFNKVAEENIPIGHGYWMEDFVMERELPLS